MDALTDDRGRRSLLAVILVVLLGLGGPCSAAALHGTVVGVSDGDTITVLSAGKVRHKVRLLGIDAPEKTQPFGARSKATLAGMVFGKEVEVRWGKRDRYDRILGKVLVKEALCSRSPACVTDVCLAQVRAGLAWWYRKYAREQDEADRRIYEIAQQEARAVRRGLWVDDSPIPPWAWRRQR